MTPTSGPPITAPALPRGWRLRFFLTCWIVYVIHFATDFVREHYLVLSMVEEQSFALDPYYGLHVDIFRNPPEAPVQGAHHGANPGISMVAAIPYAIASPVVNLIAARELAGRSAADTVVRYDDERPRRVAFYQEIRARGLDIKFGLISAVTQAFCMAPLTAWSAVAILETLAVLGLSAPVALGGAALYAFGTPVFFRAAYLNQNLAIALFALAAFLLLWNPGRRVRPTQATREVLAGALGGLSLLSDYSGALSLGLLGLYAGWRRLDEGGARDAWRGMVRYGVGALPGVLALWWYQWASFGHPFYPPQHWMAPVEWIEVGYQGVGGFVPGLFAMLLLDPRFGLFVAGPVLALGLLAPWLGRRGIVPARELLLCYAITAAFVVFFSTVQYTKLQWVTGIRYLLPVVPFLFLATVPVLLRMPRWAALALGTGSIVLSWCLSMVRDQGTVARNVFRVLVEGFQLPWLTVLGKTASQYAPWLTGRPSALPVFIGAGLVITLIWTVRRPAAPLDPPGEDGTAPGSDAGGLTRS